MIPRLLIAGTESGVGKTTVTMGILQGFLHRGLVVQPFKMGPDYIDPGYLSRVSDRPCRNLDAWLIPPDRLYRLFEKSSQGADMAILEGVMGLYDGIGPTSEACSTAQLAKLLECPVLLVLDASSLSRSAAAMARGFIDFDPGVKIVGIFLNRVSGPGHYRLVKEGIERLAKVPVVGFLSYDEAIELPERHLGLVPSPEGRDWQRILPPLRRLMGQGVDWVTLERLARRASPLAVDKKPGGDEGLPRRHPEAARDRVPIGVAMDEAFHFYYPENLELLEELGAEVVPFSPLKDPQLPEGLGALYLGGGFPEVFADRLSRNRPLHREIRRFVQAGLPTYAECGGLMVLSRSITGGQGKRYPMVGVVPGEIRMTDRLQHFGYKKLQARRPSLLAFSGEKAKGHEFHHSICEGIPTRRTAAYEAISVYGGSSRLEGYTDRSLLASYVHIHFFSNPRWARRFVQAARNWVRNHQEGITSRVDAGKPV